MNAKTRKVFRLKSPARRIMSLLLTAVMIVGILPAQAPKAQAESWVDPYLNKLAEWGVMKGDQNGNMYPDRSITRAEFVAMINRAYGYKTVVGTPFTDVYLRNWYYDDIGIAYGAGYFNGTSATTASPERTLTREEAAVVMARNMRLEPVVGEATSFNDGRYFNSWSRGLIESAARHGVISGYPDGSFQPFRSITRGEMAALVARAVGTLIKDAGVHTLGSVGGNVTITTSGVTLRDTVIAGDLYLTGGVGLGSVTLDNVTVLGKIVISGAGEANAGDSSVIIRNTRANQMIVDSIVNQFVTIRAEGDTLIEKTTVRSQAYIEDVSPSNRGLPRIDIDGERGLKVQLAGNIKEVVNLTPDSTLTLAQGRADVITIDEEATGSTLHIELGATVNTLNLDVGTTVTGKGDVGHLNVNAAGCTVEMLPDTITIRPGITANIYGEVMDSAAAIESSSSPRILAGYPAVRDVAPNSASAVFSTNKKGTLYWAISSISDGSVSEDDLINPPVYGGNIIQSGHMEMPASNTEVPIPLTNLITDGSYYVSAVLVDNRDKRSPVKVAAFTTPDNTVPAFSVTPTVSVNRENDAWATVLPSKSCQLYYAVLPQGAVAPTIDEFKTGSVSGNLGYGVRSVIKNVTDTFQVNTADLDELKDYVLYLLLIDADGAMNSGVISVNFRTLDITPPQFVIEAQATGIRERAVDVNTTINENGTIFWVVVNSGQNYPVALPGQNEAPSLTSESAKMQVENAMGNVRASGRVTATANRDTRITISQNLEPATAYDLYYVAKDTAGNYSYEVKKLTINTLDNVPPTVSQRFTSTVDEAGLQPLSTSDIEIIFSESVMDSDPNTGDSFIQLYEKATGKGGAYTQEEIDKAKIELTEMLEKDFVLIDDSTARKDPVPVKRNDTDVINGAWIDYRKAKVEMRDGKTVIVFSYDDGAINLSSGGTYHFEIRYICDVSNNRNNMTPNPTLLSTFTVAFAQATLTDGVTGVPQKKNNDPTPGWEDVRVDMSFTMTPLSTNTVANSVYYDMFLWSDKTVAFDLYARVLNKNGDPVKPVASGSLDPVDEKAMSMFGYSSNFSTGNIDPEGWIYIGKAELQGTPDDRKAQSVNSLIRGSGVTQAVSQLNTLNENYTYEFAISMTMVGIEENPAAWSDRVDIGVKVGAGPRPNIANLANTLKIDGASDAWNSQLEGEVSSIGYGRAGRDDFSVWRQFMDTSAPEIREGYPHIQAGDQSAALWLMLNRAGTVYYIMAPVNSVGIPEVDTVFNNGGNYSGLKDITDPDGGTVSVTTGEIEASQEKVTTPTRNWVYDYVTRQALPTDQQGNVKSGTVSMGGTATETIVRNLQPLQEYMVYLVTRGASQELSPVHCFRFMTKQVSAPQIELSANGDTVEVRTTTDAEGNWILIAQDSLTGVSPNLDQLFDQFVEDGKKTDFAAKFPSTHSTMKVIDALRTNLESSTTGAQNFYSIFDEYANTTIKDQVLRLVQRQTGSTLVHNGKPLEREANKSLPEDCSEGLKDLTQYYFIAAMKNTMGEVYSFKAVDHVHKIDRDAPKFMGVTTVIEKVTDSTGTEIPNWSFSGPDATDFYGYRYSGTVVITFDEQIHLLQSPNNNLVELTTGNIADHVIPVGFVTVGGTAGGIQFTTVQNTVVFKFTNATNGAFVQFFSDGTFCDANSNPLSRGQRLELTFRISKNLNNIVDAKFESNMTPEARN